MVDPAYSLVLELNYLDLEPSIECAYDTLLFAYNQTKLSSLLP